MRGLNRTRALELTQGGMTTMRSNRALFHGKRLANDSLDSRAGGCEVIAIGHRREDERWQQREHHDVRFG